MFKWIILLYVALGFLAQFCSAFGIKTFQSLIDTAIQAGGLNEVLPDILLYGALLTGAVIAFYLSEYPDSCLSHGISEKLKVMALAKVSRIDYTAYQNIGTGEMIKVIENGASAGMSILHSFYLRIARELLPTVLFSLLFISFYDSKIMLAIAAGYVVIFLVNHVLLRALYGIKSSLLESQESMSKFSVRGFMELVTFRLNKRYAKEIARLHENADDIIRKSTRIRMIHELFFSIYALLVTFIKLFVLVFGVKSVLAGESSIGTIIALILFIDQVYTPIAIFNVLYVEYKLNRVAYTRFEAFLNAPEDRNLEKGTEMKTVKGSIEFRNVHFGYGDADVLKNVSFTVRPGSSVAIVGMSGSGKSTIVKLMLGLLKKRAGQILIDGVDIDEIRLNSLYDHVSYISQDAPVFDASIRENIAFDRDMTDEAIWGILDKVGLKEKVWSLPDRLDTLVGERGMKLSGGEKQLLAFARIMAQQRSIIILDEPVSALDNINEKRIMSRVLDLFAGKTLIVIAHRLQSIRDVDRILVVKDGQIADEGDFHQLMGGSDGFRELWSREMEDHSAEPHPA
jgi:ATP-binding cassette subfamily B protein